MFSFIIADVKPTPPTYHSTEDVLLIVADKDFILPKSFETIQ